MLVLLLRNISATKIEFRCLNCCTHDVVCIPLTSQRSNKCIVFRLINFANYFSLAVFVGFLIRRSVYCVCGICREREKKTSIFHHSLCCAGAGAGCTRPNCGMCLACARLWWRLAVAMVFRLYSVDSFIHN